MVRKKKFSVSRFLVRVYLAIFSAGIILPVFWTIYTAFKTTPEFFANPWALPSSLQIDNFIRAWTLSSVGDYFLNSLKMTIVVVPLLAILGATTAYASTRLHLKVGSAVGTLFRLGIFIPTVLCLVPIFLQLRDARLLDSHWGLMFLLLAINLPFTVFVLCGYFRTMPHELEEASVIDGCNTFQTFWKVMFPLARPGIATVTIFNFLSVWNEYVLTRTIIMSPAKNTLPVGLVNLQATTNSSADWGALFAGMVIIMIPTLLIYFIFQKYITSGLTAGALKG